MASLGKKENKQKNMTFTWDLKIYQVTVLYYSKIQVYTNLTEERGEKEENEMGREGRKRRRRKKN